MTKLHVYTITRNSKASSILDMLRFLAALTVFLFHFYLPLPGYQVVMVFFVLSGYMISSTVLKQITEGKWNWFDYLLKRITRLWIVLLPCLFLTLSWASLQIHIFGLGKFPLYLDWKTFLGNLFFLQGITVKVYGLNGPLWSLSYEFWYYILFPCLIMIISSKKIFFKFFYTLLFISISFFVGQKIMLYFLIWLLGALIPFIKHININLKFIRVSTLFLCSSLSLVSMKAYDYVPQFIADFCIGFSFTLLIYLCISLYNGKLNSKYYKIPTYLAGFFYTLYLVHYPVANFIFTWLGSPFWPFERTPISIKIALAFFVVIYAWIVASLTEKHTDRLRNFFLKLIKKKFLFNSKNLSISMVKKINPIDNRVDNKTR